MSNCPQIETLEISVTNFKLLNQRRDQKNQQFQMSTNKKNRKTLEISN